MLDQEQFDVETQRRVYLTVLRALAEMERPQRPSEEPPLAALCATIDGLLEVIASLLVEARVLPNEAVERQLCEDLGTALLNHIRQSRAEADAALRTPLH